MLLAVALFIFMVSWTVVYGTLCGSVDGCDGSELGSKDTSGLGSGSVVDCDGSELGSKDTSGIGSGSVVVCNGLVVGWDDDSELDWGVCSMVDWVVVDG